MRKALPVVESFISIQGEGPYTGHPAYFLRVKKCNLYKKCPIGCDTYDKVKNIVETYVPYKHIFELANQYKHLVITGGEPTLYNDRITEIINSIDESVTIEIETNGYRIVNLTKAINRSVVVNFSPKIYKVDEVVELVNSIDIRHDVNIKIVIWNNRKVIDFAEEIIKCFKDSVWLMPKGMTITELEKSWPTVLELALKHNVKVSGRLHIYSHTL